MYYLAVCRKDKAFAVFASSMLRKMWKTVAYKYTGRAYILIVLWVMIRSILSALLMLACLVNFFPVPAKQVWYVGIAVPEFAHITIIICMLMLLWSLAGKRKVKLATLFSGIALLMAIVPLLQATTISNKLGTDLDRAFGKGTAGNALIQTKPFVPSKLFTGQPVKDLKPQQFTYAIKGRDTLTLNFTKSKTGIIKPCLLEIHGGAWRRGDFNEVAHFNNYMANAGYHVATINYRLAPAYTAPAQEEDVRSALAWLKAHAVQLNIDTNNFVVSGRSAGGHLALQAAYAFNDPSIKGVASFYGPTDMVWAYDNPDNPLIMDSKEVIADFLGGTPAEKPVVYRQSSPMAFVTPASVPTLIIHGKQDAHVYFKQSERLDSLLQQKKVPRYLLALPWATHGCEFNLSGPSGQLSLYAVECFFNKVTGNNKP